MRFAAPQPLIGDRRVTAACTAALPSGRAVLSALVALDRKPAGEIQLLPAGEFAARDGRPGPGKTWRIDAAVAARLIERAAHRATPFVIDYEHQVLLSEKNGQPAPAAGWFKTLEWREGQGLYATDVQWTERAAAMVAADEYRYVSPVFAYDKATGEVLELQLAALTNYPALDGMDAVRAAARFLSEEPPTMLLASLVAALGLAADTTEASALTAVAALKAKADSQLTEIAALKAATPDPAKFVPVETVAALQGQIAALTQKVTGAELADLVEAGLADGRIPQALEPWARSLSVEALKAYLEKAQPIAALSGTQTGGRKPAAAGADPDEPLEARCKREFEGSAALRAEFGALSTYLAYAKAHAAGQVRILTKGDDQ